jgi:CBS domain containing-hemolysin-like protein
VLASWWIGRLVGVAALLVASGLLSGSETALLSLSKVKREAMAGRGDRRDRAVLGLLANPRRLIVTIILFNELVNVGISTMMTGVGEHTLGLFGVHRTLWVTLATAVATVPLVLMFGEVTPKTVALRVAETWARVVAGPITLLMWAVTPVRVVLQLVSDGITRLLGGRAPTQQEGIREAEFRALVDVGEEEGELEVAERQLIHNVFEFGDRAVGDVMTRGEELFTLPYEMPLGKMVDAVAASRYSRVPIVRKGAARGGRHRVDEVIGVLHAKDLVGYAFGHLEGHTIQELLRPPFFVPRSTKCDRLFREFQRRKTHIALVLDEYGRLAGVVTMEDLLEELFGEIVDEKEVKR